MATDPRTIINTDGATNGTKEVKSVTINYTDPPLYGVPKLQIFNDPGGKSGAVQFNVGNRLGGDSNFAWNSKNRTLSILGNIRISDNIIGKYNTNTTNLRITGGQDGYMLSTDGTGNISWIPTPTITYYIDGDSNIATHTGNVFANYLPTYTGNVSANYFIGNGSLLTGLPASYSNTNVAVYLPTYTGNVSANYFIGNGSQLTGLPTQYANSNVANYLPTYTGNVSANYFIGNGSQLTGLPTQYANTNVAAYLPTYTGNINGNSIIITDTGYIYNIGSTGLASLTTVNVSSNLTTNAIYTDNYFYANGNVVPIGETGGLVSRTTVTTTTASLANNANANANITGYKSYALLKIQTSAAAWVRIYSDDASRTTDVSRASNIDPAAGAGIITEVITSGAQTILISPGAFGFNNESSPTTTIPINITNLSGSTVAITVTLTILQLES
jgi:hypothetical protein